jgi:hypothetical protein
MIARPPAILSTALCVLTASSSVAFQQQAPLFGSRFQRMNNDDLNHPHDTRLKAVQEFGSAAAVVDDFFRTQPFLSAFVACSVKASAADLLAQTSPVVDAAANEDAKLQLAVTKSYDGKWCQGPTQLCLSVVRGALPRHVFAILVPRRVSYSVWRQQFSDTPQHRFRYLCIWSLCDPSHCVYYQSYH